jgi:hypothetical protein
MLYIAILHPGSIFSVYAITALYVKCLPHPLWICVSRHSIYAVAATSQDEAQAKMALLSEDARETLDKGY